MLYKLKPADYCLDEETDTREYFLYTKANFTQMKEEIRNINWQTELKGEDMGLRLVESNEELVERVELLKINRS